jgi:pimeloyl-ACP methyl ester carboxylesterase
LSRPHAHRVQLDLFYDYRTNAASYPTWQEFLREHQPPTLVIWGQGDIFFTPEGGEAYLRDLPNAEILRLASGHFAIEPWQGRTVFTGVFKDAVTGPRRVGRLNVEGDGQGDLAGYGGEQRAVFVYQDRLVSVLGT